jgi:hypothetical protein
MRNQLPLVHVLLVGAVLITSTAGANNSTAPGQTAPTVSTLPSISGTYRGGQTLTEDPGSWSGPSRDFAFQWVRCDSSGLQCAPIPAATQQKYALTDADVKFTLRVVVTATNKNASTVATSNATPVIAPALSTKSLASTSTTTTTNTTTPTTTVTTATTTATTATTTVEQPYLRDDFSGSLSTWKISDPDPLSAHPVGTYSTSVGQVADLTVDPTDIDGSNSSPSSRVDLWMYDSCCASYLGNGSEIWGHVRVLFPSAALSSTPFRPTNGAWNWTHQLHYGSAVGASGSYAEHGWNVVTGSTLTDTGGCTCSNQNPHLVLSINGGDLNAGTQQRHVFAYPHLLQWDHWYDLLYHEKLSPNASIGFVEAWVDGNVLVPYTHMPTLYSRGSTTDTMYPELSNYRWMGQSGGVNWSSSIFYDSIAIGPSRASVNG